MKRVKLGKTAQTVKTGRTVLLVVKALSGPQISTYTCTITYGNNSTFVVYSTAAGDLRIIIDDGTL